ncbi:MAG: type II secretion system protein GspJ [Myxococcota bacterium]
MKRAVPHGFTLIEVMGVILVTTILLAVAINFFVNLSRQATRASENTREVRRAATILDRIAADLEHTILVSKPAELDPLSHPWVFFAESRYGDGADRLQFMMRQVPRSTAGPAADLAQVAYTLHRSDDTDGDTFTLRRWAAPGLPDALRLEFPPEDDPNSFVVADDLRYFGFRFLDGGGNWVTEWNSAQLLDASELPVAVEVQVALKNGAPPVDEFGFDDQPRRHVRHVQLPLRPLDLVRLFDPDGDGARGTSSGEDGEDPDLEGLTIADCIDFNAIDAGGTGLSSSDISTLEALAQQAGDTPFAPYSDLLAGHPAVSPSCR